MEEQESNTKAEWAKAMGVSRSGFYSWRKEREVREARYKELAEKVERIFKEGKNMYGAERICGLIRKEGGKASFKKVQAIMREKDLYSVHKSPKRRGNAKSGATNLDLENLTKGLVINQAFQVLSSDITYISTKEGWDYLCQIRDVYSNTVLAYVQQSRMTADIVLKALELAMKQWVIPKGSIFHSDRGSQYTAKEVMETIRGYGLRQSFSCAGRPAENAWSESFFAILKKEIFHRRVCKTREEARQRVFEYIEGYYNRSRVQKRLGYLSPTKFLLDVQQEIRINVS
jgi:putative transposase